MLLVQIRCTGWEIQCPHFQEAFLYHLILIAGGAAYIKIGEEISQSLALQPLYPISTRSLKSMIVKDYESSSASQCYSLLSSVSSSSMMVHKDKICWRWPRMLWLEVYQNIVALALCSQKWYTWLQFAFQNLLNIYLNKCKKQSL